MIDLVLEPRAVQLHLLDARYGLVSHLSYVGGDYETFSPISAFRSNRTPEELREMVQHNYEALRRTEYEAVALPCWSTP